VRDRKGGRTRLNRQLFAVAAPIVVAATGWLAAKALQRAQEAADYSCLASLHAALDRQGVLSPAVGADWKEWTDGEVAVVLSKVEPRDCADDSWWQRDVGIRTRRSADGDVESQLWRKSQPTIFSRGRAAVQR
jgi:hypothetical protein